MSKEECLSANWYDVGYNDGLNGEGSSKTQSYLKACSEYVHVDVNSYNEGRKEAAAVYCTDDNGYNLGSKKASLTDICNLSSNQASFKKYYNRGLEVYRAAKYVNEIDDQINKMNDYGYDHRMGPFNAIFRSNQHYLQSIRGEVYEYYLYVKENAKAGNAQAKDYSYLVRGVPYPYALENARVAKQMLKEADDIVHRINNRIDDADRCARLADDEKRRHDCNKRLDCLKHEKHRLKDEEKRAIFDLSQGFMPSKHFLRPHYEHCMK